MEQRNITLYGDQITTNYLGGISSQSYRRLTDYLSSTPVNNPGNFKDPNPFSYTVKRDVPLHGTETFNFPDGSFWYNRVGTSVYGCDIDGISNEDKAGVRAKALSRLNSSARGDLNLSITIAEAHQVKRMVSGVHKLDSYLTNELIKPAKGNRTARLLMKSGATLGEVLKSLGKNWLSWQYGYKPLLSDIWGIADNLLVDPNSGVIKIKGSARLLRKPVKQKLQNDDTDPVLYDINGIYGFRYHVLCSKAQLKNPLRWASLNPLGIAWELLPYSFVVDWVYDIGGYLRELETSYLNSTNFRSGYTTELDARKCTVILDQFRARGVQHIVSMEGQSDLIVFNRKVLSSWPFPEAPRFKVSLGTERLLSAASLLALHLGGSRR